MPWENADAKDPECPFCPAQGPVLMTHLTRLSLHVPSADLLPRDYSALAAIPAGAVPRPPIDVPPGDMRHLAFSLIRVLDDEGQAHPPWDPDLSAEDLRDGLRAMLLLRAYDARMMLAQRQGKTSFYMQHLSEEAVSCGVRPELSDEDMNFPTYRQAGLLIAGGCSLVRMMNQVYSNPADSAHGRQLPVFYSARDHGFFSISGNLATQLPQAVGWAMASAIRGAQGIAVGWVGDGSTAESDFHAALLFAARFRAPFVLNIVNNQFAISTRQCPGGAEDETLAARGLGFGLPALRVDGNDYLAVRAASRWAVARARANLGPTVVEYVTYRRAGHSTSDNPSAYRPADEAAGWPLGDPVQRLARHLIRRGEWSEERQTQAEAECLAQVVAAQKEAEANGTLLDDKRPASALLFEDVYAVPTANLLCQRKEMRL